MNYLFALLLALSATSSLAAGIPNGHSEWELDECPEELECNHSVSDAHLIRTGDRVCGEISESSVFRQPSAWFVGRVVGSAADVRFFDSFQSDDALPGTARIEIVGRELSWHVLEYPKNGMIPGKLQRLRLISTYQDTTTDSNAQCSKLVQDYSKLVEAAVDIKPNPSVKRDGAKARRPLP